MGKVAEAPDRPPYRAWLVVFLANLPVPLMFAWNLTMQHGRIGMAVAIVLCWYFGHRVGAKSRWIDRALVAGGIVVALSQVIGILHISAGVMSLEIGSRLGQVTSNEWGPREITELGGLLVTILTGGILMTVAMVCGSVICLIFPDRRPRDPEQGWDGEG